MTNSDNLIPRKHPGSLLLLWLCVFLILVLAAPTLIGAQQISVPITAEVVRGTLVAPSGEEFDFSILNGGTLRIEEESGNVYAVVIAISEEERAGDALLQAFQIDPGPPGEEGVKLLSGSEKNLYLSDSYPVPAFGDYSVQLVEFKGSKKTAAPMRSTGEYQQKLTYFLMGSCCVTCSGITVCGCEVAASCGSCSTTCGPGDFNPDNNF